MTELTPRKAHFKLNYFHHSSCRDRRVFVVVGVVFVAVATDFALFTRRQTASVALRSSTGMEHPQPAAGAFNPHPHTLSPPIVQWKCLHVDILTNVERSFGGAAANASTSRHRFARDKHECQPLSQRARCDRIWGGGNWCDTPTLTVRCC